jgi:hypothetical protein
MGLKRDLERAISDVEQYRKKLNENLARCSYDHSQHRCRSLHAIPLLCPPAKTTTVMMMMMMMMRGRALHAHTRKWPTVLLLPVGAATTSIMMMTMGRAPALTRAPGAPIHSYFGFCFCLCFYLRLCHCSRQQ